MRVDHVSYAAEKDGVRATADRLAAQLGVRAVNGGVHPSFGTRNVILPMAHERYVEVVEPLDHPATDKAPFGQAVKTACEAGGGWMGWVVRVEDIAAVEQRLDRASDEGHRVFPDGRRLDWRQIGVHGLINDPQLPYFIHFLNPELHPSRAVEVEPEVNISGLTLAGDPARVREWLGLPADKTSTVIDFSFIAPKGNAGLLSVTFDTPAGQITI
ncbi:VOC family protein [Austwickia sp. TVS 96-490-7B]|uniref:VOC family protein n=1 Tax=Austwickia sp. TVS 96-490-7B TaxID=2830843 RepID=UPI001C589133|nr:VOC family protein [Austwickia sp. TVS 96-490-7B]